VLPKSEVLTDVIDESPSSFSFGIVISEPGLKLTHDYVLRNTTHHDIKITNLVNLKSCCGEIRLGRSLLRPGEETNVSLTLVIGDKVGDVVHKAIVETEPPASRDLVLTTSALAYPSIRTEEVTAPPHTVLCGSRSVQRVEFAAFAAGTPAKSPIDLDQVVLQSQLDVKWLGPKQIEPSEEGVTITKRRFVATLSASAEPESRQDLISLKGPQGLLCGQPLHWEVVPTITVSPKVLVLTPGKREYTLVLSSHNHTPFRITRIDLDIAGLRGEARSSGTALVQTIRVIDTGAVRSSANRSRMTIETSHPNQSSVMIPVIPLD
jgi:hypothetical protein